MFNGENDGHKAKEKINNRLKLDGKKMSHIFWIQEHQTDRSKNYAMVSNRQ